MGTGSINEFAFSPCGHFLAVASQDGYLRVFNYDTMELVGIARSYFGGATCVCWSPDGKYVVFGGEDDLVTVYSPLDKRVVARGQGHKSWVTRVAFDRFNMSYGDVPDGLDFSGSDEEDAVAGGAMAVAAAAAAAAANSGHHHHHHHHPHHHHHSGHHHHHHHHHGGNSSHYRPRSSQTPSANSGDHGGGGGGQHVTCYRLGSVGEDTLLCLWDLTEDLLKKATLGCLASSSAGTSSLSNHNSLQQQQQKSLSPEATSSTASSSTAKSKKSGKDGGDSSEKNHTSLTQRLAALNLGGGSGGGGGSGSGGGGGGGGGNSGSGGKEHKRNFSLTASKSDKAKDKGGGGGSSGAATPTGGGATGAGTAGAEYVKLGSVKSYINEKRNFKKGWSVLNFSLFFCFVFVQAQCPRLMDVPLVEPLVSKKVSHERLTALAFLEECLVTACQDGYVCTWARPGRGVSESRVPPTSVCTVLDARLNVHVLLLRRCCWIL